MTGFKETLKDALRQVSFRTSVDKLKKKGIKGDWSVDAGTRRIKEFEEAFEQIHRATGMTDIDDLVTSFIAAEDQNFSLFNFVNELNQETEKLEETAAELRAEMMRTAVPAVPPAAPPAVYAASCAADEDARAEREAWEGKAGMRE